MKGKNYSIWIEAEHWAPGEWNMDDVNTDVNVDFEDGSRWMASFFTYKNIETLSKKNATTGECLNGKYFWSSDMILVDKASRERIEQVVAHLIQEEEFEVAFTYIGQREDLKLD